MNHDLFRILLLEDDLGNAEIARRTRRGCEMKLRVQIARDGVRAAFRTLDLEGSSDDSALDLTLYDSKMPNIDGHGLLPRPRSDAGLRDVPSVVLTSSVEISDERRHRRLGATEFRTKPIAYEEYKTCVREIARRWLAAREGRPISDPEAPPFDVRAAVQVGHA